jgi:hypothetical protein
MKIYSYYVNFVSKLALSKLFNYPGLVMLVSQLELMVATVICEKSAQCSVGSINGTFSVSNQLFSFHGRLDLNALMYIFSRIYFT